MIGLMFEKATCTTRQKLLSPPGNLLHFDTQLCKSWAWSQLVLLSLAVLVRIVL